MSGRAITLELPSSVYDDISRAARKSNRPIEEVVVEALSALSPVIETAPAALKSALAQMAYLNDAALWQAARSTMTRTQRERLQELHNRQDSHLLTTVEQSEEQALLQLYRETVLLRAQAAVLLKHRGYDVADPDQFAPLE